MSPNNLILETDGPVQMVRLNRPKALNALNSELLEELIAVLHEADRSPDVRVLVITGSEKAFAAGADIGEMSGKSFAEVSEEDMFGPIARAFRDFRKPVIAAVSGYALGGGCELAMLCDFVVASETAKFGQPEINLGVIPGLGGSQRLTLAVGKAKAMDMNLTGRMMDAAEAERAGLVSRVVSAAALIEEAMAAAKTIADKSMIATRTAKEAVNRSFEMTLEEGLLHERRVFHALFSTLDQKEGMAAFLEKRQAKFRDQ